MFGRFHAAPEAPHTMTAIPVQLPPLALDPTTRSTLLQTIVDTLPYIPNSSDVECCAAIKVRKSDNQGEKAFCRLRRREGGARPEAQATEELV
jgi:hypothetical protein